MKLSIWGTALIPATVMTVVGYFILREDTPPPFLSTLPLFISDPQKHQLLEQVRSPAMVSSLEAVAQAQLNQRQEELLRRQMPNQSVPPDVLQKANLELKKALQYGLIQAEESDAYLISRIETELLNRESEMSQEELSPEYTQN